MRRSSPRRSGSLAVRGAPAIGVAAAYGLALAATRGPGPRRRLRDARVVAADGREPPLGARRDAGRSDARARPADPRGRGRAVRRDGRPRRRARAAGGPDPDPLQRGRSRDGRLRLGGRCDSRGRGAGRSVTCVGGRDTAAAPGSALDRVRARGCRHSARGHRRLRGSLADGRGRGRHRDHRRRPHRRERRQRQQDRHLQPRRARPLPRDPVRDRGADLDDRSGDRRPEPRSRSRSATEPR